MQQFLLVFSALVVVLFLTGVFYSTKEFHTMKANPEENREEQRKVDTIN